MSKQIVYPLMFSAIIFASCQENNPPKKDQKETPPTTKILRDDDGFSRFIPIDSANKMIMSYIKSTESDDDALRSLILNADSLRYMLSDSRITNVKLMFAHTLDYVNNGGKDQNCGYKSGKLTLVIAGYDQNGDYVYNPTSSVLNQCMPCPAFCPTIGTSTSDSLVIE